MAVRRDYLLQLAQQVAQMLAAILGHREAGRSAEAGLVAEEACAQLIGLPLATVRGLTPESLAGLLAQNEAQRVGRSVWLAELLIEDAALNAAAVQPAAGVLPARRCAGGVARSRGGHVSAEAGRAGSPVDVAPPRALRATTFTRL